MPTTEFNIEQERSEESKAAEAQALADGERIAQMQQEERERVLNQNEQDNNLIAGKFRSQEDLVKAYEELQRKLSQNEPADPEEAPQGENPAEEAPEEPQTQQQKYVDYLQQLGDEFNTNGELSEESIENLSKMDSKDLIQAYLEYNSKAAAATMQQAEVASIQDLVGGSEAYGEMMQWASDNLQPNEIADFNAVTATNNPAAIKFAVIALSNRMRGVEGFEAPMVSGKGRAEPIVKGYRSHAELARDIADPRYSQDPAFRQDVMNRMTKSNNLL